ncbi:PepSY domain-containing protein [Pseudoalteromonas sp. SWXJZ94C]|uniref:PepSY-associated TM helix domain-containing protein n=1 Tax=Pseudoalteromonas sp. SWXJZ94C TaxID=2792065 RepID=UPI0018CDA142|nr:PepSY-associated TM helix domain-containing protein [Pseudoalteromonas sp. SWXJZ94C]MBH0055460.1 PepSY domain-containing protein [Pseudoalteromonas sp. SWXJZ94C]
MKSITLKKLFLLHSWVGIVTAVLLFIIAFSGALAVLSRPELKIWANPELQTSQYVPSTQVSRLVNEYYKQVPSEFGENIHVYMPSGHNFYLLTLVYESHHGDENYSEEVAKVFQFHPDTLALVDTYYGPSKAFYAGKKTDAPTYIGEFHADLHLGRPIGLILTGFLGLTLLVSAVTGLFIHRKLIKELFTFRRGKGLEIAISDAHKVIGIWGSVFNVVIGFTGAFLGLATIILLPAAAFVSFGGDQDKLIETFTAIPETVVSHVKQPTKIDTILENAHSRYPDAIVRDVTIMAHNDANAQVYIRLLGGEAVASQLLHYQGNGEFVQSMSSFGDISGISIKVIELMFPLHFGNFSGIFVKLLWVLLGFSTALLPISGMMMWLAKRTRGSNPTLTLSAYARWNRFIIGSCGGLVLASFVLFPVQVILNYSVSGAAQNAYFGPIFFYSWLGWLLIGLLPMHYKNYFKLTLLLCGLVLSAVLPLNILFGHSNIINFNSGLVAVVDASFMLVGIVCIWCALKIKTSTKPYLEAQVP